MNCSSSSLIFIVLYVFCIIQIQGNIPAITHDSIQEHCKDGSIRIVESIPQYVNLKTDESTYEAWKKLIQSATETLDMAIYYMTLTEGSMSYPLEDQGWMGLDIYREIVSAHKRGVKIRIVQNEPGVGMEDNDTRSLAEMGVAEVRSLNWTKLINSGILHTKVLIVDKRSVYLGSANTDWRSLSQVKELGLVVEGCQLAASDASMVFDMYWMASHPHTFVIPVWPDWIDTLYNIQNPAAVTLNGNLSHIYLASSPSQFCTNHRSQDVDAILNAINNATKSICISVMDYSPSSLYAKPNYYWSVIDDALRSAAFNRGVQVRLMASLWNHTSPSMFQFLKSLDAINNIDVKLFHIPEIPDHPIPFARVNHAKYMVTDSQSYVGTSNWSADYFLFTGGLSYTVRNDVLRDKLQSIFDRDWGSAYAQTLP